MLDIKEKILNLKLAMPTFKRASLKNIVVVEIGNDWLKIIENSGGHISKARAVKLVDITTSVPDSINKIFKEMRLSKKSVYLSIPRYLTTVRVLEFPSTNEKEIDEMVMLQVGKQTPYSKEEILSAYRTFDSAKEGYTKAVIIIARRGIISERVEVLKKAGIEIEKAIISSEGVYQWFCFAHLMRVGKEGENLVVVDIDSNYSDFIVIKKGKIAYSRNILIGSNSLIGEVGKWEEKFIEEVAHSIDLYYHDERYVNIDKVFLSGAGVQLKGLDQFLSTRLSIPVEMADTNADININNNIDFMKDQKFKYVSMTSLLGLSLRYDVLKLDITPRGLLIQKEMDEQRKQVTIMGVLAISIVMLIAFFFLNSIYSKNVYLSVLKSKILEVEKESKRIDDMRMSIELIKDRIDSRKRSINVFYEIHKLTPEDIYYTSISIDERKQTVLQGNAEKMSNVFEFVTILENSPMFENVKTTYASSKKSKNEEFAKFEIICMSEEEKE